MRELLDFAALIFTLTAAINYLVCFSNMGYFLVWMLLQFYPAAAVWIVRYAWVRRNRE